MQIPVILITGFLGAGKTSFINYVIGNSNGKKISLILNEFGDIKLETQFIKKEGVGLVTELNNGCLCCVANVDLPRVIRYTLEHAPKTEYLIIEASGLSDPDPVRATLQSQSLSDVIYLDTTIAIVDADNFVSQSKIHPLIQSQIADADFAIISKVQSHTQEEVSSLVLRVSNIGMGTRTLIWDNTFNPEVVFDPPFVKTHVEDKNHHHVHATYDQYWYTSKKSLNPDKVVEVLRNLGESVLRVKGYTDFNGQRYLVQKVGNHVELRITKVMPSEDVTAILVLGSKLHKDVLETQFTACTA